MRTFENKVQSQFLITITDRNSKNLVPFLHQKYDSANQAHIFTCFAHSEQDHKYALLENCPKFGCKLIILLRNLHVMNKFTSCTCLRRINAEA